MRIIRWKLALLAVAVVAYVVRGRRAQLHWGARPEEIDAVWPGDDVLPTATVVSTRAISIDAPAASVWPWIVQIGQGRGGFYSYERLENLVGCRIHNADAIVAEWQNVAVGDDVRLHPDVALRVVDVQPGRSLVLFGGATPDDGADHVGDDRVDGAPGSPPPYQFTWAFVLVDDPSGGGTRCRLVVRERFADEQPWARAIVEPLTAASWVMTQRMLRSIRDRATGVGASASS